MGKKLTNVKIKNVLRLKAVEITPEGPLYIIEGQNKQGKSSIISAINMLFAGGRSIPDRPIRDGESKGEITGVLDDGTIIKRTFSASGSKITATGPEGRPISKAQTFLSKLFGPISFDPGVFIDADPAKRIEILRQITGLDFSEMDQQRAKAYESRTDVNREIKRIEGQLASMPEPHSDVPDEEVSLTDLFAEVDRCEKVNSENNDKREELDEVCENIKSAKDEVDSLLKQIATQKAMLVELRATKDIVSDVVIKLKDEDVEAARAKMRDVESINQKVRENAGRKDAEKELRGIGSDSDDLTMRIDSIDRRKEEEIADVKLPIDGLGFSDSDVTFHGLPFDQASTAEQVQVSGAIAISQHPDLDLMLIDDGEKFDQTSLELMASMAEKAGITIIMAKVGTGEHCQLFVEDGAQKNEAK